MTFKIVDFYKLLFFKLNLAMFHLSVIAITVFSIAYGFMNIDSSGFDKALIKARFLSAWCSVLQIIYFTVSLLNDIYGTNAVTLKSPPLIRRTRDNLFSLVFPITLFVFVVFWSLDYLIDRDLLFPKEMQNVPTWLNHVVHSFILPNVFIELLVTRIVYPSRAVGLKIMTSFIAVYISAVWVIYVFYGVRAYPFLELVSWRLEIIFWIFSLLVAMKVYLVGEKINNLVAPKMKIYKNGVNAKMH